ncbi:hypothetical protein [Pollutibacter soli]|uniref:hypothetical protein n=1 Tax=Pollutibacter soli TaxID=3034157 RepID=UPI003013DBB1
MLDTIKKLRFTGHNKVLLISVPKECEALVIEMKKQAKVDTTIDKKSSYSAAMLFVQSKADLKKQGPLITKQLGEDAVFWVAYPKKTSKKYSSDVNRDIKWSEEGVGEYETVSAIAIDDDWSALRFRKPEKIKSMIRRQSMAMTDEGKKKTVNKKNEAISKPALKK